MGRTAVAQVGDDTELVAKVIAMSPGPENVPSLHVHRAVEFLQTSDATVLRPGWLEETLESLWAAGVGQSAHEKSATGYNETRSPNTTQRFIDWMCVRAILDDVDYEKWRHGRALVLQPDRIGRAAPSTCIRLLVWFLRGYPAQAELTLLPRTHAEQVLSAIRRRLMDFDEQGGSLAYQCCPRCRSQDLLPVVYGLPSAELSELAGRGAVVLAGCSQLVDDPDFQCAECGSKFAVSDRRQS